jgi:hypothetical protein
MSRPTVIIVLALLSALVTVGLFELLGLTPEAPTAPTRFTDAEERHLDTLNSLAAMELLKIATAKDPELYGQDYADRVDAAYRWTCKNTSYLGGKKTVPIK